MATLSKAKTCLDAEDRVSLSRRRKFLNPLNSLELSRAKMANSVEEQQLAKKLRDLEKDQSKMRSERLQLKASLLPEITITSFLDDGNEFESVTAVESSGRNGVKEQQQKHCRKRSVPTLPAISPTRKLSAPPTTESDGKMLGYTPAPPTTVNIRRSRSMADIHGRRNSGQMRAKSAVSADRPVRKQCSASSSRNSSTESLPCELSNAPPAISAKSGESSGRRGSWAAQPLLTLRKARSTSNVTDKSRRMTVDAGDIFRNPSYNPMMLGTSLKKPAGWSSRRRLSSPMRLSNMGHDGSPSDTGTSTPTLEEQFEQLKACRYLRTRSDSGGGDDD